MGELNAALLWKTYDHIVAHPEEWVQETYRCGAGFCFAGHAAVLAGAVWYLDDSDLDTFSDAIEYVLAEPDDNPDDIDVSPEGTEVVLVGYRAQRILGLDMFQRLRLFHAMNDTDDFYRLISEFTGETR